MTKPAPAYVVGVIAVDDVSSVEVWCDRASDQRVSTITRFRSVAIPASREDNEENREHALWEGWSPEVPAVSLSLVAHEVLHAFIGSRLWSGGSAVLRMLVGEKVPYAHRLYEESLIMSFARWVNHDGGSMSVEPVLVSSMIDFEAYRWREDWKPFHKRVVELVSEAYR